MSANLKQQLDADLKKALLSGDKVLVTTLRGLKSVILYAEVAAGTRDTGGVNDEEVITLFAKEAKKRQESADLYIRGGSEEKAQAELEEKRVIETYLPKQLSDQELEEIVARLAKSVEEKGPQAMGKLISLVRQEVGASADGGRIATKVREILSK